jgi:hypothetical protein
MDAHSFLLPSLGQEHLIAAQVDGRPSFSEARRAHRDLQPHLLMVRSPREWARYFLLVNGRGVFKFSFLPISLCRDRRLACLLPSNPGFSET